MGELLQKRVTFTQAAVACAITLLTAVGGTVAWASQFQTKAASSVQDTRTTKVEKDQSALNVKVDGLRDDVGEIRDTVNRLDDKLDRVLLKLSGVRR